MCKAEVHPLYLGSQILIAYPSSMGDTSGRRLCIRRPCSTILTPLYDFVMLIALEGADSIPRNAYIR